MGAWEIHPAVILHAFYGIQDLLKKKQGDQAEKWTFFLSCGLNRPTNSNGFPSIFWANR
ncbi:hypothetical protein [Paenibacillus sp. RC21]|uniref:hypothetical protein n=1 Tax=Paenibacillus sp. RC21 TaxID=3156312 RepID=UPI00383551E4